jgi:hypothetical protein
MLRCLGNLGYVWCRSLVCQGESASMARHLWMGSQRHRSRGAVFPHGQVHGRPVQRLPLLAEMANTILLKPAPICVRSRLPAPSFGVSRYLSLG